MNAQILDVDLLAFERGTTLQRGAVVDGVRRSLATGFVYTKSDLSSSLMESAYGLLERFFSMDLASKRSFEAPGTSGQTGYTGVLRETAAGSDWPDWKEMLNWAVPPPRSHPLRRQFPILYPEPVLPDVLVPGLTTVLSEFHHAVAELQRRFLRVVALAMGCSDTFFEEMVRDAPTLTRAIHYPPMANAPPGEHVWASAHADINLITALPRASGPGLQVEVDGHWVEAIPPDGQVIINSGLMLERLSNGLIPAGRHRVLSPPGRSAGRLSVVQFCHARPWTVLAPVASCCTPDHPQRFAAITAASALEDMLYEIKLLDATAQ